MPKTATALDWSMYKTVTVRQMQDVFDLAMKYGNAKSQHTRIFGDGPPILINRKSWDKECDSSNDELHAMQDKLHRMLLGQVKDYMVDGE